MKKSLSAILVVLISMLVSKNFFSKIEMKISKGSIKTEDGGHPGDNGRVRNGGMKSPGIES